MKAISLVIMLSFTALLFSLEGSAVSSVNATLDNTGTLHVEPSCVLSGSFLGDAYPNPFYTGLGSSTNINFTIKAEETGIFTIFNVKGQIVETRIVGSGEHIFSWEGKHSSSGIYFYKLVTPSVKVTKKIVLLK